MVESPSLSTIKWVIYNVRVARSQDIIDQEDVAFAEIFLFPSAIVSSC